jgi:hypothetical protein
MDSVHNCESNRNIRSSETLKLVLFLYFQFVPLLLFINTIGTFQIWKLAQTKVCQYAVARLQNTHKHYVTSQTSVSYRSLNCGSSSSAFFASFSHPFIHPLPFDLCFFPPSVFSFSCKLLSLTSVDYSCFPIVSSLSQPRLCRHLSSSPLLTRGLWRASVFTL